MLSRSNKLPFILIARASPKPISAQGLQNANLQGPIPWGQMSNGNGNGQIGNGNRTAAGFSPTHSQPARPNSAQGKSPNPYIQSPMMASAQSIQQNNLENLQRQQQVLVEII